jgi:hypothetical protein
MAHRVSAVSAVKDVWLLILNVSYYYALIFKLIFRVESCLSTMNQSLTLLHMITLTDNDCVNSTWERNSRFTPFTLYTVHALRLSRNIITLQNHGLDERGVSREDAKTLRGTGLKI